MTKLHPLLLLPLLCLVNLTPCHGEPLSEGKSEELILQETVKRYFASMGGYEEGDLIARSHIKGLQVYLRRTRGHSVATHPKILGRFLPDDSRLVRIFYWNNGAETLRAAVAQGGSYEEFDRLSRNSDKLKQLNEAIDQGAIETLSQLADQETKNQAAPNEENSQNPKKRSRLLRIYTVDEYLAAVTVATEKVAKAAAKKAS